MIHFRKPPPWLKTNTPHPGPKPRARGRVLPGHQRGKMNEAEAAYGDLLAAQKLAGEIADYWFEAVTLTIADPPTAKVTRWTPDFMVLDRFGYVCFVDVKGTRPRDEQAEQVKIKAAAERYPHFRFVIARQRRKCDGGGFVIEKV